MKTDKNSILVVDDDVEIRNLLHNYFKENQFKVITAQNGKEMMKILSGKIVDIILLDVMMPGIDGLTLCKEIRKISDVPIIILTAVDEDSDRILGLEFGADDYLTKPFNPRVLLAKVKSVLRRIPNSSYDFQFNSQYKKYKFNDWMLDTATRTLTSADDVNIAISAREYEILVVFLEHPQKVLSREQLLDITSDRNYDVYDRSIDVQISRLRQKIDAPEDSDSLIKTVRGGGYLFKPQVEII